MMSGLMWQRHKKASEADAVSYEQVSFAYPQAGEMAIRDIDFKVPDHGTVGIIGGTGSGKSTVLHLLNHMYDASKGKVLIYGKDVRSYKEKELTKIVGLYRSAVCFSMEASGTISVSDGRILQMI